MSSSPNSSSSSDAGRPPDWLNDVACPIEVILGSATVKVADCSRMAAGSVLRLKQAAGSDLQILVGGVPFAMGEVVINDDLLSVRVARLLPPSPETLA